MKYKKTTTKDGKEIRTILHESTGRQDVKITVKAVNVDEKTPEGIAAKKVINEKIIPQMKQSLVTVVVIHKPTNASASKTVPLPQVRSFAEAAIRAYNSELAHQVGLNGVEAPSSEFVIVEVHEGTNLTRVSTLQNL